MRIRKVRIGQLPFNLPLLTDNGSLIQEQLKRLLPTVATQDVPETPPLTEMGIPLGERIRPGVTLVVQPGMTVRTPEGGVFTTPGTSVLLTVGTSIETPGGRALDIPGMTTVRGPSRTITTLLPSAPRVPGAFMPARPIPPTSLIDACNEKVNELLSRAKIMGERYRHHQIPEKGETERDRDTRENLARGFAVERDRYMAEMGKLANQCKALELWLRMARPW